MGIVIIRSSVENRVTAGAAARPHREVVERYRFTRTVVRAVARAT